TDGDFASAFEIDPSADEFEPNELLAAARMAVPSTDSSVVRTIVAAMRAVKVCRTPELDELATRASACLANEAANEVKPAELGYKIARWVRDELGVADDEKVDPASMLRKWNVHVGELCVDDDGIEAVACWGRQHGPAILVNRSGRHSQDEAGRRATLAHEICHLLVDRSASLPLAEVFGGHVFRSVEQRAGAFAAQLLVPREMAGRAFLNARSPGDVLSSLAGKYGASRELIAWQTYNSGAGMNWGTFVLLRNQVSRPERFLWNVASGRR
ncbi:MAG TPA: ImmA/IrrE family metallo-endopeptidase, partial [Polyangiaceae bacterium]|nr:ImmA/IrrE family metallo-endopeptidase [Polyangiaceae bacterium]